MRFLHKKVLGFNTSAPQLVLSEKELKIQEARRVYIKTRNLAIAAYQQYKELKGDYYKNK